jgi:hypothetical protein
MTKPDPILMAPVISENVLILFNILENDFTEP